MSSLKKNVDFRTMLTQVSIGLIEPTAAYYPVKNIDELKRQIQACSETHVTGRLDFCIQTPSSPQWSLFFRMGYLIWGTSPIHPIRRWCRQLSQHCPNFGGEPLDFQRLNGDPLGGYPSLAALVKERKVSWQQMRAAVIGTLLEILFDIIQWVQLHQGGGTALSARWIPQKPIDPTLALIQTDQVFQQTSQNWDHWRQAGLADYSPNLAPIIWDAEALQNQTSTLVYHNLRNQLVGDLTLRDLAVKLKHPVLRLLQSVLPYIRQGAIGMSEVQDLYATPQASAPAASRPVTVATFAGPIQAGSPGPLVVYIEDSQFDALAMSQILARVGCQFINIRDPIQALPMVLRHRPGLIFLDLLMPQTNGYEVCGQIRRVSALKETPVIIVTSNDGLVDRVRAKLVGATAFISKPIDSEKVFLIVQQYLPLHRQA
ncbi:MAG: response regulator [Leptolyngbyaceae cyanobacterium MO_188.B28]|nr:response regulator [Leptolyngbyaceae cyanobacterium MO_188.B28]